MPDLSKVSEPHYIGNLLNQVPRQSPSQASLNDQLIALQFAAQRLGLYDAADFLRDSVLKRR